MLNVRALLLAVAIGTVLQVAMVVAGHTNKSIAGLFAVGGMTISLIAGVFYAVSARGAATSSLLLGGMIAGAVCALLGIFVSYMLGDVPASLLALGTISSAATGALGGWLGKFLGSALGGVALLVIVGGAPAPGAAQTTASSAVASDTTAVVAEAVIEASNEAVWNAWATDAGLRSWLAPHAAIDLRVGGLLRTSYAVNGSLGDSTTIVNTILSLDPQRMLSIQVSKAPAGFPFPSAIRHMWTVMYFEPLTPSRTKVRVVGLGFGSDAESQEMRSFFHSANATTLQHLQRRFAPKP